KQPPLHDLSPNHSRLPELTTPVAVSRQTIFDSSSPRPFPDLSSLLEIFPRRRHPLFLAPGSAWLRGIVPTGSVHRCKKSKFIALDFPPAVYLRFSGSRSGLDNKAKSPRPHCRCIRYHHPVP